MSYILRSIRFCTVRATPWKRNIHSSMKLNDIADGAGGTHKPTPFQEKILVWTKTYKSASDIPRRITKSQMKNAMDRFRVRMSLGMVALTFIFAAAMAMIGRKERREGKTITKIALESRPAKE